MKTRTLVPNEIADKRLKDNFDRLIDLAESAFKYKLIKDPLMVNAAYCGTCKKPAKTREEAEFIKGTGECFTCDHVRGDVIDDMPLQGDCAEDFLK